MQDIHLTRLCMRSKKSCLIELEDPLGLSDKLSVVYYFGEPRKIVDKKLKEEIGGWKRRNML